MQMAEDYAQYWDLTGSDEFGTEVYFSRVNDGTEEEHLPMATVRSAGSLCFCFINYLITTISIDFHIIFTKM